jgi:hypothetical protein
MNAIVTQIGGRNCLKMLAAMSLALLLPAALPTAAQQSQPGANSSAAPSQIPPGQTDLTAPQPQDQQQPSQPPAPSDAQAQTQPNPPAVVPQTLTLPAGTVVRVRVDEWISSDRNVIGDNFSAVLEQPLVVDGWVVARRGQSQTGHVSTVKKGHIGETSQLGLELPQLTLVDGQQLPLQTELFQASAGRRGNTGRDVATVGGTTGLGAVIGGIAGGGTGAAIGAGIGATAGVVGVMSTRGRPTVIAPETVLSFRLKAPVTISTEKSQFAFQPVTQSDYDSHPQENRPHMRRQGPPPPPYGYPYPYAYASPDPGYPGPFIGFGYYGRFGGWR